MTVDRTARGSRDDVVSDGDSKRRHEQADSIVNPEPAECCAPRTGDKVRYDVPHGVRKHREDNAADNVPAADIQVRGPSSKKWQDELEDHQDKRKHDECSDAERKLRPLQWLTETGSHQHPSWEDYRKIPDNEEKPSEPAAQDRTVCQAWHSIIKECQESIAQPSEEYAFRVVVAKPAPG